MEEAGLARGCEAAAPATAELILDAVVGTGFKPPLRGLAAALREMVAKVECAGGGGGSAERVGRGLDGAEGGGGVSRGCGGDVYAAEDGACVWESDGERVWAGGGGGDWVAGRGGDFGELD